jgi:hypothetical protein
MEATQEKMWATISATQEIQTSQKKWRSQ